MTSSGTEERDFQIHLRDAILAIAALGDSVGPEYVLVRPDDTALLEEKFPRALCVIHDFSTHDESHKFGTYGGQITFLCTISIAVRNSEQIAEPLPGNLTGISAGPSLALIDGALRNAFHISTLDGWCMDTNLGPGLPIESERLPSDCVGRRYSFTALKEVQR